MVLPAHIERLHQKVICLSQKYKTSEIELLDAIVEARKEKLHQFFECPSLYDYCTKILKLDAGVVYGFMAVANRAATVPELREKIKNGTLSISTAKRITSVLTVTNKAEWFEKATTLSNRQLEREVARVNPKAEVKERASYLSSKRVKLELGLDEKLMLKLRRIQDLESQKQRRSVRLEDVLQAMADLYLRKSDPVEKAKRAKIRGPSARKGEEPTQQPRQPQKVPREARTPVPAKIMHEVNFRDQGECQHINQTTNEKCKNRRFIEIHHKKPLRQGGAHTLDNLVSVCSEHHKIIHKMHT